MLYIFLKVYPVEINMYNKMKMTCHTVLNSIKFLSILYLSGSDAITIRQAKCLTISL